MKFNIVKMANLVNGCAVMFYFHNNMKGMRSDIERLELGEERLKNKVNDLEAKVEKLEAKASGLEKNYSF